MKWGVVIALMAPLAAQESRFDVQSRLVMVPVTVTDPRGRTLDGLEAEDFEVLDEGRARRVSVDTIATGVAPISLVIAVQTAGISRPVLEKVRKIGAMIEPMVTGERGCAAVVTFDERVRWMAECTGGAEAVKMALAQLEPGFEEKRARMLDAVREAVERLGRRGRSRKVLLLISETRDRGSEAELESVMVEAERAGVTVYAATYSAFKAAFTTKSSATAPPQEPKPKITPEEQTGTVKGGFETPANVPLPSRDQQVDLKGALAEYMRLNKEKAAGMLAERTGGREYPFTRMKGLEQAIQKLGAELHSQYVLSFAPEVGEAGYHRLEVRVKRPGEWRVRARPGYWRAGARTSNN